jgi:molecular chaperone GrpE
MNERESKDYAGPVPVKVVDRRWWARADASSDVEAPAEVSGSPGKPTYVEDLERQLREKDELLQSYITRLRQASDEFEAVKARLRRDVAKEVERGRRVMLVELLDVLDNLERATAAARNGGDRQALIDGVDLVQKQFASRLAGFGATRIEPVGQPFDPRFHEAVTTVPTTDPAEDGRVVGVVRPGYVMGDEVLRAAQVAVASCDASTSDAQ